MTFQFTKSEIKDGVQYYKDNKGSTWYLNDNKDMTYVEPEIGLIHSLFIGIGVIIVYVTFPIWIWGAIIVGIFKHLRK